MANEEGPVIGVYDPKDIFIVFGTLPINPYHYTDGDFVRITPDTDLMMFKGGAGGGGVISENAVNSYTITITLLQTALVNKALRSLAAAKTRASLIITDKKGLKLFTAEVCWIQKIPEVVFGVEPGPMEWTFRTNSLVSTT